MKVENLKSGVKIGGIFTVQCHRPDGSLRWEDTAKNLVVDEGLDYMANILLKNGTRSDPWYIGLMSGTPSVAAGDSLTGTHVGWTEITAYSEGTRQEFVDGAIASHVVNNSGSKASFTLNANGTTVGGPFLADSATTGANGTLLCAAAFTAGNKSGDSGDTITVQYDFSVASA